jgi:hypothetical protein
VIQMSRRRRMKVRWRVRKGVREGVRVRKRSGWDLQNLRMGMCWTQMTATLAAMAAAVEVQMKGWGQKGWMGMTACQMAEGRGRRRGMQMSGRSGMLLPVLWTLYSSSSSSRRLVTSSRREGSSSSSSRSRQLWVVLLVVLEL